ncbi:MAG: substrate-binding domain-containing protein, partial [Fibrobacteria bacterium]|nr:substrate-binding domain-containing protein [Fibrobacteria bacterium]
IGLSMGKLDRERWQKDQEFFVNRVKELGGDVLTKNAGGDPATQLKQCDELLQKGVKVLVVMPCNSEAAAEIVSRAHKKSVKVISYDRLISTADVDLYVTFNNVEVGKIQASSIIEKAPHGNYLILKGDPGDNNSAMLYKGQMKVLKPFLAKGDIKIIQTASCKKWSETEAYKITAGALKQHKIDAIIASNDAIASGAIKAMTEMDLQGKIPISGQDADLMSCQYIAQGIQTVTVYKPIKQLAEFAAAQAVKACRGVPFDNTGKKVNNGRKNVPTIFLEPVPVTRETLISTIIKSGFHTKEEVYAEKKEELIEEPHN